MELGIREFPVGQGVLRFNPADPNLLCRLQQAVSMMEDITLEGGEPLSLLSAADRELKDILSWVFGPGNDLQAVTGGVSLLSVDAQGKTVLEGLLEAVQPVLLQGARDWASAQKAKYGAV